MRAPNRKRSFNAILMRLVHRNGWVEDEEAGNSDPLCLNPSWVFRKKNWCAIVFYKQREVMFTRRLEQKEKE